MCYTCMVQLYIYWFLHRSQRKEQRIEAIAAPTVLTSAILIIIGIILAWFKFKGTDYKFVHRQSGIGY